MSESPRFSYPADIMVHMSDANRVCRAADLMRLMQQSATRQLEVLGPNLDTLQSRGHAFILSRISIDFPTPVHTFDNVLCTTWPCASSRGVMFDRCFEIFCGTEADASAGLAARAASQWAFLDYQNQRLLRVEDADISFTREETATTSLPLRFRIPKDAALIPHGEKTVRYSDIDTNRHLNNTHYCDLYCDCLPMDEKRVAALSIAFLKEAPLGETITVLRTEEPDENGVYYFRTVRQSDGAVNTEAMVRLTDL